VEKGRFTPYGAMVGVSQELRKAYYTYGYRDDADMPELPCPPDAGLDYDLEYEMWRKEIHTVIKALLDGLTPKEARVIRMRFGIDMGCEYTLKEIALRHDVTQERIRQIEAKALRKLKLNPERKKILVGLIEPEVARKMK
jgi:RNA polymerase sigma factor (sigma-70 family)